VVQVTLWGGLVPLAGGHKTLDVEASSIRELFRKLEERYPSLSGPLKTEVAVAINGTIYRDDWSISLPKDAEIYLMRRLAGG